MKKIFSLILTIGIVSIATAQEVLNDVNAEKRTVTGFHGIHVSNAFNVYLTQGNEDALAVSASEERFRDKIKAEVKDGILYISYENGVHLNSGKMKLKAYISFKNLDEVKASGACDLFVLGDLVADDLSIDLSGASDMKDGKLDVRKLSVHLSGASDMKISGNAPQLRIDASGASDFKAYDLITDYCNAEASGASSIQITVNKELSAKATGASDVNYKGEAVIRDLKTSGASSVSKRS
ncbi:MAG TPA: head GIN domain-containing protein [Chitinophagaceae bacterium]|nr:head GIN domain-containing protein [Chitinophagaceae bacterium]